MAYTVKLTPQARKQLHSLTKKYLSKIIARIDARPPGIKKLSTRRSTYRVRQGQYRTIYEIRDQDLVIVILSVTDRKDPYR
ncbi:MAG: type II toxin-antitoxin system RelE/ParE family toxin [Desulfomonilaceae bacterium]